jgi:hypothetical protein
MRRVEWEFAEVSGIVPNVQMAHNYPCGTLSMGKT